MSVKTTRIHGFLAQLQKFQMFLRSLEEYEPEDYNAAAEAENYLFEVESQLQYLLKEVREEPAPNMEAPMEDGE